MAAEQPLPPAAAAAVESQSAMQPAPAAEVSPARLPPPAPPPQQQAVSAEGQPPGRLASISETAEPAAGVQLPLADGEHHVRFADGSQFFGEVQGGSMHGRGIFVWRNGVCLAQALLHRSWLEKMSRQSMLNRPPGGF